MTSNQIFSKSIVVILKAFTSIDELLCDDS